jgi:hypothetical protein
MVNGGKRAWSMYIEFYRPTRHTSLHEDDHDDRPVVTLVPSRFVSFLPKWIVVRLD